MRVAFDFDGTLVDSMPKLEFEAVRIISREYGLDYLRAKSMYRDTVGMAFKDQLTALFPWSFKNIIVANQYRKKQQEVYETVTAYPGAVASVTRLVEAGIDVCVCSSSERKLTTGVVRREFPDLPIAVYGREDGRKVQQLETALKDHFSSFVGDAIRDGDMARKVGVHFIGVEHTFARIDFQYKNFFSVPTINDAVDTLLENLSKAETYYGGGLSTYRPVPSQKSSQSVSKGA